jgi:transposase
MERLGDFLFRHIEGIAAYCDHPVRFGVVESIDTTIKAVLRRARGMRDERMLLLKLISPLGALYERSTAVLKSVKTVG